MGKNKKILKDPSAPKKPMTPFFYFIRDVGKSVKEELYKNRAFDSDKSFHIQSEVAKECGKRWSSLSVEEKDKYKMMRKIAAERFEEEMKSYTPSAEYKEKIRRAELAKSSVASSPAQYMRKIPANVRAYFDYLTQTWPIVAAAQPHLGPKKIQDKVWKRWVQGEFRGKSSSPVFLDENQNMTVNQKKRPNLKRSAPRSPKQANSAFQCFLEQMKDELRKHLPDLSHSDMVKHVTNKWKVMTEAEKEPFLEQEREAKAKYFRENVKKIKVESEDKDMCAEEDIGFASSATPNHGELKAVSVEQEPSSKNKLGLNLSLSSDDEDFEIVHPDDNDKVAPKNECEERRAEVELQHDSKLSSSSSSSSSSSCDESSNDGSDSSDS